MRFGSPHTFQRSFTRSNVDTLTRPVDPEVTEAVAEAVNTVLLVRGGLTAAVALITFTLLMAVKVAIAQFARARRMRSFRGAFVYRVVRFFAVIFTAFVLAYVWGVSPGNLWVFLTGFIGLVAIGFFAVWSLLSNLVAGVFLFLSDPFKVEDEVEVVGEEIAGRVLDIRPLFVVLGHEGGADKEGVEQRAHTVFVPNSLFFQKAFRRLEPAVRREGEAADAVGTTEAEGAD